MAVLAAGAATFVYASAIERLHWTLRRADIPVLAPDAEPLRILHISDLHLLPHQQSKQEWVRTLAALDPDFVALTGDNLSSMDAVPSVVHALQPLLDRPGAFVFGNNDYFAPVPKHPFVYFNPDRNWKLGVELPWADVRDVLIGSGWADLNNARTMIEAGGRRIEISGVDDPHLHRDNYDAVSGPADPAADLHLGLLHSPEPHVLDRFADDGFDLLLAGHTHGGQVRVPFYGAIVTNCGIDRECARGTHRYRGDTWLNVSAGLGTSPYAPVRLFCPPEASLLTLVPRPETGAAVTRAQDAAVVR